VHSPTHTTPFPPILMMQDTAIAAAARKNSNFFIVRFILPIPKIRFFGKIPSRMRAGLPGFL
jgi:hypothetical protein